MSAALLETRDLCKSFGALEVARERRTSAWSAARATR